MAAPDRAAHIPEGIVIPFLDRVTIMELRESMCSWPLGDPTTPDFRFCGQRSPAGVPYCSHHARVAYQPAADRKRGDRRMAMRA
jgi:GcrA cell cycle regulator